MKVTFLELYNEEITGLLAPDEPRFPVLPVSEDKTKKPIALMEDGKGGVFVRGLEEEVVYSAGEIYKILDKGSAKRRTAETLLNKQSSRSHSIFSITIHIKELTHESEEMIKIGKLNLVDLAGSENISRSGARDVSKLQMSIHRKKFTSIRFFKCQEVLLIFNWHCRAERERLGRLTRVC